MDGAPTNAFAAMAKATVARAASAPRRVPDGSGAPTTPAQVGPSKRGAPTQNVSRSPQFQRPNSANNAGGVPRQTGNGQRQLDGTRTPEFSQPQRKTGLAQRDAAPARQGGSGIEHAMGALADQMHPPRRR